jgi:hypothetical protein
LTLWIDLCAGKNAQKEDGDMIIIIESNAHSYCIQKERETRAVSMSADGDIEEWGTIILSIVIGLLALWFFLAMGGIFALIGPWMIFATIHLVQQKRDRKVGGLLRQQAIQLVELIRIHHMEDTLSR